MQIVILKIIFDFLTAMGNIFPNNPVNWPENVSYQLLSHFVELGVLGPCLLHLT